MTPSGPWEDPPKKKTRAVSPDGDRRHLPLQQPLQPAGTVPISGQRSTLSSEIFSSLSFQGWSLIPCEANQKTTIWCSSISPARAIYYNPQLERRWGRCWLCPGPASPLPCTPQGTLQKEVPGKRTQGLGEGTAPISYSGHRAMRNEELNPGDSPQRSRAE